MQSHHALKPDWSALALHASCAGKGAKCPSTGSGSPNGLLIYAVQNKPRRSPQNAHIGMGDRLFSPNHLAKILEVRACRSVLLVPCFYRLAFVCWRSIVVSADGATCSIYTSRLVQRTKLQNSRCKRVTATVSSRFTKQPPHPPQK